MKKFKFTLQTVHNVRELKKEKEQFELAQLQLDATKAEERVAQLEAAYRKAMESYSRKVNGGKPLHIGEMELETLHLSYLDEQKRRAVESLADKKRACVAQSQKLAAATREVKVTRKLRENQSMRHQIETAKHEQTAIDELVSARFARNLRTKQ